MTLATPTRPSTIRSYQDLTVWQRSMDLVAASYTVARKLPSIERFELAAQIRRASVSVPANIAEGYGRRNLGDYVHHLHIANGSLKELETEVLLVERLGYLSSQSIHPTLAIADQVGRMLAALSRRLKASAKKSSPRPKA